MIIKTKVLNKDIYIAKRSNLHEHVGIFVKSPYIPEKGELKPYRRINNTLMTCFGEVKKINQKRMAVGQKVYFKNKHNPEVCVVVEIVEADLEYAKRARRAKPRPVFGAKRAR